MPQPAPIKLKILRAYFGVAGRTLPGLALNTVWRLLFKPKRHLLKPPHLELIQKANEFTFAVNAWNNKGETHTLTGYSWGTGNKTILLMHGWDSKAADYYKMIPSLLDAGYRIVAFDGPGHGSSEGTETNMLAFKEALHAYFIQHDAPFAIVGHSMGGTASAFMLSEYEVSTERLVMIASPIVSRDVFEDFFDQLHVPARLRQRFYTRIQQRLGEPVENYDLRLRTNPIKASRILAIYDKTDEVVAYEGIKPYFDNKPAIEQFTTSGAGHQKILRHPEVIKKISDFLA
jgi:pimeloyl-ACP methyl ester carboxylesterase